MSRAVTALVLALGASLPAGLGAAFVSTTPAAAQEEPRRPAAVRRAEPAFTEKQRINANTVGVVAGRIDSSYLAAAQDMSAVLDDGNEFRVLATIGKGALQNVEDVLHLQNTDIGITQSNVLSYLKKTGELGPDIADRVRYIAKLFNEEVHIVAGSAVADVRDLDGKKVNFGEKGSGTRLTAELIFEALGIKVVPVNLVQSDALVAVQKGEIAATVMVSAKPSPIFDILRLKGELKLLPIPYEEALEADYLPTRFTHEDYPTIVPQGEMIETVAVPAVLAVYNWKKGTDRHRRAGMFVERFFGKFEEFRKVPRHPKWREVNLAADVPGWQRFDAASEWLAANAARTTAAAGPDQGIDAQRRAFQEFLASQRDGGAGVSAAQQEALFRQFLDWMNKTGAANAPSPPAPSPAQAPAAGAPSGPRLW
ncbi:MAG: TAXI family TRAP transporter solute-binding subunit [Hyphomicrobiaceae bacterium]|nr:TAXI family TRAP transporter solute-binding subunit [Hyphomicrobiaceae bacterium]